MAEQETTFSVEVRSFPTGSDDRKLRAALALTLGITESEARDMIEGAPVLVLQGSDAAGTKRVAGMLVKLGAEIVIHNEQTGEKRVHGPAGARSGAPAEAAPATSSTKAPSGALATEPTSGAPAPTDVDTPKPPAAGATDVMGLKPPTTTSPGDVNAPPIDSVGPVEVCGSCARSIDEGTVCTHCGWHNADKRRYCKACKKDLVVGSDWFADKKIFLALAVLVAAGLATGAYLYFGPYAAGAALGFVLGLAWIGASSALSYRCGSCGTKIESYALRNEETRVLGRGRIRGIVLGGVFAASGLGLVVPAFAAVPDLFVDSFGTGWRASAPFTHRDTERRVLTVRTEAGEQLVRMQRRSHARFTVRSYVLMHAMLPESMKLGADAPRLEAFAKTALEAALGASLGPTQVVDAAGSKGQEGVITASDRGEALGGRARVLPFGRDVVIIAFLAAGDGAADQPSGLAFLNSLATVKP